MTAQLEGRRGAGSRVLGWLLPLLLPAVLAAQPASPVDTLTREDLARSGRTRLAEILQALIPGITLTHPSGAGGSDHLPPVTLRGLGTDQVLVLVNGKRRVPSPLVYLHEGVGRGQNAVEWNAIPVSAIERIEIHGPGDAARYGFGAVAGVIDVILREAGPDELTALLGTTTAGDGTVLWAGGSHHLRWGDHGRLQASAELARHGGTNRALPDTRLQYFPGDPRNDDPALSNRVTHRYGEPESRGFAAALNAERRLRPALGAYGFANLTLRRGEAAELWRRPSDDRTVRAIYPNGFLPLLVPTSSDAAISAGLRGATLGWRWDASLGYGRNSTRYRIARSANASLGPQSPTRFDAGRLRADEFRVGVELSRRVRGISLQLGGEHRSEGYQIEAGEPDSYRYGAVPILDGPNAGDLAEPGAQGFPAFRPDDGILVRRGMIAGYAELATRVRERLSLTGTGRLESYRGVRTRGVYQLSAGYSPIRGLSLHGGYGTGYRVPSLAQSWFSSGHTTVSGLVGLDDRTVPVDHPIAIVLGAERLKPEHSRVLRAGVRWTMAKLSLRGEYSRIAVDHRIILSGSFADPAVQSFLAQQDFPGIGAVRFFANALATRTNGLQAAAGYQLRIKGMDVRLQAALEHRRTRVRLTDSVPGILALYASNFFGRSERVRLEHGQPRTALALGASGARGPWRVLARAQRFGSTGSAGIPADGSLDQVYRAKWLTHLGVEHQRGRLRFLAGVDNLFDRYPDRNLFGDANSEGNSNHGMFPYSGDSPFGFAGRYLFLKVSRH